MFQIKLRASPLYKILLFARETYTKMRVNKIASKYCVEGRYRVRSYRLIDRIQVKHGYNLSHH